MSARERRYEDWAGAAMGNWANGATSALKLAAYDAWAEGNFGITPPERVDVEATATYFATEYVTAQQRLKERHDDNPDRTVHA